MHDTNPPIVYRHWLADAAPKAAPVIATSTVLILARLWNAHGAEHSIECGCCGAAVIGVGDH
jgi:hypothetical protein